MTVADCVAEITKQGQRGFSNEDWTAIADLIKIIPPVPGVPLPLFLPLMKLLVPAGVELLIVRERKILLVLREFMGETGYHLPGAFVAPGESFLDTARRCGKRELGLDVLSVQPFGPTINQPHSPRFHDAQTLLVCQFSGEPNSGEWFGREDFPKMLGVYKESEPYIRHLLF